MISSRFSSKFNDSLLAFELPHNLKGTSPTIWRWHKHSTYWLAVNQYGLDKFEGIFTTSMSTSLVSQAVKVSAYNAGDVGSIPGWRRSPGEGNGNPLQYSCLENPMDRGAWQTTVHWITMSQTQLKWLLAHKALGCSTLTFFTKIYTVSPLKLILHLRVVLVVVYVIIFSLICIQSPMPSYIWCLFSLSTEKLARVNLP